MKIGIINGPNLNLLGTRETDIYGSKSFEDFLNEIRNKFSQCEFLYFQSNVEGEIVNHIQKFGKVCNAIIINPAAYSHTSIAIADAIAAINAPCVEVHISNIFARENYRHHSYVSEKAVGVICGLGLEGYELAIHYLINFRK